MSNPKIWTHTNMYANPENQTHKYSNLDTQDPDPWLKTVPESTIRSRVRNRISGSRGLLANIRSYNFGSLREKIAELAPYANDYEAEEVTPDA